MQSVKIDKKYKKENIFIDLGKKRCYTGQNRKGINLNASYSGVPYLS